LSMKKAIIGGVVVVSIATFTYFGLSKARETGGGMAGYTVDLVTPMNEVMDSTVMVPGKLELVDRQLVTELAEHSGFEILVDVGDEVEEGTPLVQYDTSELDFEQQDVELQIEKANGVIAELSKQEEDVKKRKNGPDVKPTYETDEETGEKTEIEPVVTVAELDAELAELAAQKKEEAFELTRIKNQLESIKEQKAQLTVKSKIAGTVIKRNDTAEDSNEGLGESATNTLLEVADTSQFTITGNISEQQSLEVEPGHPVMITSDTVEDGFWEGEVVDVSYFPTESDEWYGDSSSSQYPVTIKMTEGDTDKLRPGYQVYAEIITMEHEGLALPMEAIQYDEFSSFVYVYEDGIAVRRDVEIGIATEYSIEILEGVTEADEVILDYMGEVHDGMTVTPAVYEDGDFEEGLDGVDEQFEEGEEPVEAPIDGEEGEVIEGVEIIEEDDDV
jgi:HlyD family secretion protein